ncbi:NAD(P)H-hydrate dehydratase [bacterium]|nr:NAD(P)H-hydrate dehydratase [bacterium]
MQPVLTAEQMRRIDRASIDGLGLPGAVLMESAGRAVACAVVEFDLTADCRRPVVLCGKGNNGGDGFVAARWLTEHCEPGWPKVFLAGSLEALTGAAATMARVAVACGLNVLELEKSGLDPLKDALGRANLVLDALLGTGAAGAPRGLVGAVIDLLAGWTRPLVAVDAPSGVQMDDGQAPGACLSADLTVTFGYLKVGHLIQPGRALCGEVVLADIGFPEAAEAGLEFDTFLTDSLDVGLNFPPREPDSHKGDYGRVLVVGGSTGLTGAPVMAAQSAMTIGAGLVTAAPPASLNAVFEAKLTEVMSAPLPDSGLGYLAAGALEPLLKRLSAGVDVLALGPGLGRAPETADLVRELVGRLECPAVLDADGLNAFEGCAERLSGCKAPLVITPHPGEMGRLSGLSAAQIKADPLRVARGFAMSHGLVLVLKGNPSLIADRDGRVVINPTGGPSLAKGGSGDVLTGMIAGLLAQGLEPFEAAVCAVYLHGLCADLAAKKLSEYCVSATELLRVLPEAINSVSAEAYGTE